MSDLSAFQAARLIDHTLLRPEATRADIDALCDEAMEFRFGAVCVNPVYVRRAVARLEQARLSDADRHGIAVVSVAGFPLGACASATKVDEARRAVADGASEIDMVVQLGALIEGDRAAVSRDIEAVAMAVHESGPGCILKVILETGALTKERIVLGCRCAAEGGADYVKTSTGFHPSGGATTDHVRRLRRHASPMGVKASGGIRTAAALKAMVDAGASRIGTSSGVAIVRELRRAGG